MIDDGELLAWLDGELENDDATRIAAAVDADPVLAARAAAHRRLAERLATGFAPMLDAAAAPAEVGAPVAPVASFADAQAARRARTVRRPFDSDWQRYAALAATLMVGLSTGVLSDRLAAPRGIADVPEALVASATLSTALDQQLSDQPGSIRISLSFRNHVGEYCRSFTGAALAGIACRDASRWQLRYAAVVSGTTVAYRAAAAGDPALLAASDAMIDGVPLDAKGELTARQLAWRSGHR
jgi:hypothetical protein